MSTLKWTLNRARNGTAARYREHAIASIPARTQGLTENTAVADGTAQYLQNHTGYERAWLGPWEHVRGNERDESGRLKMGRAGFFDEVMRFYDQFLKGVPPTVADPPVAVQTNDGKWRAEDVWPPADAKGYTSALRSGSYTDDGSGSATGSSDTEGVWTISPRLQNNAHLSGSGTAVVDVATTRPNANLVVDVYDLDEFGIGPLITRQGFLARSAARRSSTCGRRTGRSLPGTGSQCA